MVDRKNVRALCADPADDERLLLLLTQGVVQRLRVGADSTFERGISGNKADSHNRVTFCSKEA